jgi:large subunit ribosomal protein L29
MNNDELAGKLSDLKEELFNLRFQQATGQLQNPVRLKLCKKDIARVLTILRERQLGLKQAQ